MLFLSHEVIFVLVSLSYFLAVAKYGNITKAAEELFISQPALSASIIRLEKKLDVTLLKRGSNGITLTNEGECVLKYAKDICLSYDCMLNDLKAMNTSSSTSLRIGSGMAHSANVIDDFLNLYPEQAVSLVQYNNFFDLKKALLSHEIDMCISSPPVEAANVITKTLCTERLCVAFGEGHPFAEKELISLDEIVASKRILALPTGFSLRIITDNIFSQAKLEPQYSIQAETNALASLLHKSRSNGYVAIYPVSRCRELSRTSPDILYRPIEGDIARTIAVSWLDRTEENERFDLMLDFLCRHYAGQVYQL